MEDTAKKVNKKTFVGKVVSNKMEKTIVVRITNRKLHRLYKKYVTHTKRIKVHDPKNECAIGDVVKVIETRPISKDKCWGLVKIIEKAR